ncbi:hypothetical protein [Amycolatopsis sp. NPDC004169]|uniref:hypothetical protein n=1 Tax=Amycolatopsis sp. NPDC004169 TaxID=3154453 RepID=UPI0033A51E41
MFWTNTSPLGAGGDPRPGKAPVTYPLVFMTLVVFGYLAYLMQTGFPPRDALIFAACSTAVLGGVIYLPNGLGKLIRLLGQQ